MRNQSVFKNTKNEYCFVTLSDNFHKKNIKKSFENGNNKFEPLTIFTNFLKFLKKYFFKQRLN